MVKKHLRVLQQVPAIFESDISKPRFLRELHWLALYRNRFPDQLPLSHWKVDGSGISPA